MKEVAGVVSHWLDCVWKAGPVKGVHYFHVLANPESCGPSTISKLPSAKYQTQEVKTGVANKPEEGKAGKPDGIDWGRSCLHVKML